MRGDWQDRRDERYEDEGTIRRLDRTLGRGHAYAASGGPDRYAPNRERMRDEGDDEFPRRHKQSTPRFNLGAGTDYGRSTPYEEPFSERYGVGVSGHLYGQHTGHGIGVERYTGRWEETIGPYTGRGPKNFTRRDDRIRDEIADRLTADPWIDPSEVDVAVESGRVVLSGTVADRQVKYRIEEVADSVSGVGDVENRIKVRRDPA